jgi:hypothetical protein
MTGVRRTALRSSDVGLALRTPDILSVSTFARVGIFVVALTVPLNNASSPEGRCEEFRRVTMAVLVEQVLAKDASSGAGTCSPDRFETSTLDRILSTDCSEQETP